jgi:hypothetical protein
MGGFDLLICVVALLLVASFSVGAGRAEERLWKKCRRKDTYLRMQQQITMGKAHCR